MYRNIKVAFFDYDRTLFIHEYPAAGQAHPTYEEECFIELTNQAARHKGDKPVKCMQWFVKLLQDNGCVCYVLTHEIFNLRNKLKSEEALRHYSIDKLITVDSSAHKIDMMRAVAKMHNINPRDCLLVDDKMQTVYDAASAGFTAIPCMNVAQLYESIDFENQPSTVGELN